MRALYLGVSWEARARPCGALISRTNPNLGALISCPSGPQHRPVGVHDLAAGPPRDPLLHPVKVEGRVDGRVLALLVPGVLQLETGSSRRHCSILPASPLQVRARELERTVTRRPASAGAGR